jgi:hypothetical protein
MTKKEIKLVQVFTDLETAWARMEYYTDQEDQYNEVDKAIKTLKEVFYSILLEDSDE